jgi:hypothetical protein
MLNTKLLLVLVGLVASIGSFCVYERHREAVIEQKAQEARRPMRTDEKQAMPSGWAEALKKR